MVERIRELCKEKGTNFSAVEKELGFANASIKKTNPNTSVSRIYELAQYFGVSMEFILTGTKAEQTSPAERQMLALYRGLNDAGRETLCQLIRTIADTPAYQNGKKSSISESA